MLAEADFAGAAGRQAFAAVLYRLLQVAQGVGVQLGGGEAFVAGKTAAVDAFRNDHLSTAAAGDVQQGLRLAEVLGGAGDMHGDWLGLRGDFQAWQQVLLDEAHRLVDIQARVGVVLQQAQGAGAGIAIDGVQAAAAGLQQGIQQALALCLGFAEVAFRLPGLAAAQAVGAGQVDDLVAGLFQQGAGFLMQRLALAIAGGRPHGL